MAKKQQLEYIISGNRIGRVNTMGSWNDNNCIMVEIAGESYRINVNDLVGILAELKFRAKKKIKHTYLTPILDGLHENIYLD